MTSLWLLSRIRFGVVEMGFEPKNVTKITSYHITSTQYVYCISESSRVVVGCFSFVMLCEKGTNDSLVHFASPPFTFVYRYIPIQYVYEHFGGTRSNIRFWGGTCHYHLNCVGMYLVLTIQGSSHTQGLNPQFLVGQTISNSIYHTFNLSALFALLTHQVLQILANNILSTR